jgi:hypothetical protein
VIETAVGTLFPVSIVDGVGRRTFTFAPVCTVIIGGGAAAASAAIVSPAATTAAVIQIRDTFERKIDPPVTAVGALGTGEGLAPRNEVQPRPRERMQLLPISG